MGLQNCINRKNEEIRMRMWYGHVRRRNISKWIGIVKNQRLMVREQRRSWQNELVEVMETKKK